MSRAGRATRVLRLLGGGSAARAEAAERAAPASEGVEAPAAEPEAAEAPDAPASEAIDAALGQGDLLEVGSAHRDDPSTGIGHRQLPEQAPRVPVDSSGPTVTGGSAEHAAVLDRVLVRRGGMIERCFRNGLEQVPDLGGTFAWEGTWARGTTADTELTTPSGSSDFDACTRMVFSRARAPEDLEGSFRVEWTLSRRAEQPAP